MRQTGWACGVAVLMCVASACEPSSFVGTWEHDDHIKKVTVDGDKFRVEFEGEGFGGTWQRVIVYDGMQLHEQFTPAEGEPKRESEYQLPIQARAAEGFFWIHPILEPMRLKKKQKVLGRETQSYRACVLGHCSELAVDKKADVILKMTGSKEMACTHLMFKDVDDDVFDRPW